MTIQTLIFDLDDTLFDTWGQLVKPAAREACEAMLKAGLNATLEYAIETRESLFLANPRADVYGAVVAQVGVREGACPTAVRDAGHNAYFNREVEPHITLEERTAQMLADLAANYRMYLVTSGHPDTQQRKVALLGLAPFFEEIYYVNRDQGMTKKAAFETILKDVGHAAPKVLCIGDRPDREIRSANALNMVSVRVNRGEFAHLKPECEAEEADHLLDHVTGLVHLLERLSAQV